MARLATIGDSLAQGFQSLAIHKVELSFPTMIAECLGTDTSAAPIQVAPCST
jgi:hypothetical protein